jgi:hypothetical protein
VGERNAATLVALLADNRIGTLKVTQGEVGFLACELLAAEKVLGRLRHLDLSGNLVDGRAATVLASAIRAGASLETLDLSHNRICVGLGKRPGFEKETFHSRNRYELLSTAVSEGGSWRVVFLSVRDGEIFFFFFQENSQEKQGPPKKTLSRPNVDNWGLLVIENLAGWLPPPQPL